ncbi:MAG: LysR substrate-binding domain-containing protein [Bacteroidota bacterium]|nr:LysR substrate-binding domain-containing protein [Bacteroidota bacterium]
MNISQLEYIIAVDNNRHFVKAAECCFVTQATLSMMIKKLEEELDVKIFDRNKHPVIPTREGKEIIIRARKIVAEINGMGAYARELKEAASGELLLGIIPTLAPYLLPLFLKNFTLKYPNIKLRIKELVTAEIISKLKSGALDIGILATPLGEAGIEERPLFYEEFFAYVSKNEKLSKKKYLLSAEIYLNNLWLLEEGHCLRNQVFNLCELKKQDIASDNLHYEAGSIETLINMVDKSDGITIVPFLAAKMLKPGQKVKLREFANPKPVREISLASSTHFPRRKLLEYLANEIGKVVPPEMISPAKKKVASIML